MNRLDETESAMFFYFGLFLASKGSNVPERIYRVTDEVLLTETAVCTIFFLTNIITALRISFAITEACVVPCGSRKMSPLTISIVQIIVFFWSFEISESIPRNQKIITGLDSFLNRF